MGAAVRTGVRRTARVLTWAVLLVLAGLLAAAVVVPRLTGATTYTVLTGSMAPSLPPGTLIVVRPVDVDAVGVGSVVTYQVRSGAPEVVTHRVVAVASRDGEPLLRTQGDANDSPDADWVRPVQLRGTVWYAIPHVGRLDGLLPPEHRRLLVQGAAAGLFCYAFALLMGSARERLPRRRLRHG